MLNNNMVFGASLDLSRPVIGIRERGKRVEKVEKSEGSVVYLHDESRRWDKVELEGNHLSLSGVSYEEVARRYEAAKKKGYDTYNRRGQLC